MNGEELVTSSPRPDRPVEDKRPLPLTGTRVLVIEDMPDARTLYARIFEQAGAIVHTAGSAEEAWELLSEIRPNAIVSDIGLPKEDGLALMRRFRIHERAVGVHTPALAITAYSHLRERAMEVGFDQYLVKPASGGDLLNTIMQLLRSLRANRRVH